MARPFPLAVLAGAAVCANILMARKRGESVLGWVYLGIIGGLLSTCVLAWLPDAGDDAPNWRAGILATALTACGAALVLRANA